MNTNIKTAAKLAAFAGAFALTGCAFVPDTVHPTYTPPANVSKVPGADKVVVDVIVKNEKKRKNEVSVTKDGYGFKMAGVYMHVAKDVKTAIDKGLQAKGFTISNTGPTIVHVNVEKFYLTEHVYLTSEEHTGYLIWNVAVKNPHGKTIYSHSIKLTGVNHLEGFSFTDVGRSASAKVLLQSGVNALINNHEFIDALLASSHANNDVEIPNIQ
ncbi:YajG family lipoprotein [Acidithiobacillus thiooxidans]|uniref:YajG family lipoprotein n=1 Tax=Acidithiobacillus thiooxidans TaxID=930 RepID=UPI0004E1E17E|nr:YajG family lipoprotein [Acidithiobacillus thiooxidans]